MHRNLEGIRSIAKLPSIVCMLMLVVGLTLAANAELDELPLEEDNVLENGTFDEDTQHWENAHSWSSMDANQSPDSGSARIEGISCLATCGATCVRYATQCVPVDQNRAYTLNGKIFLPAPAADTCGNYDGYILMTWWSEPGCTGSQEGFENLLIPEIASWTPYQIETVAPIGTQSVAVSGGVRFTFDVEPAIAYIDDQVLTAPEPHVAMLELAAVATVAGLARLRVRRQRK